MNGDNYIWNIRKKRPYCTKTQTLGEQFYEQQTNDQIRGKMKIPRHFKAQISIQVKFRIKQ